MPSAWGHTRLLETDWRLITQESHCFSCGSVKATPEEIKRRFGERMRGSLLKPLEMMLEKQMNLWKEIESSLLVDSSSESPEEAAKRVLSELA